MKFSIKITAVATAALLVCGVTLGQTVTGAAGNNSPTDVKLMGDVDNSKSQSTSNQINPSANAVGVDLGNAVDVRNQNTTTSGGGAGGAATGNLSNNDNKSSAGANNSLAQVVAGQATVGPTSSQSGGNILGGATSGGNIVGPSTATAQGGAGGQGGQGGQGGAADVRSSNANSAKQGQGQGQGQQQGNLGINGQSSKNVVDTGDNTQSTSAGNGAGAGAGSGNKTANVTRVDAADRSVTVNTYEARAVAWAPIIQGPAAPALASANLIIIPGQCGPRVRVVATNVIGKQFGPFGGQYDVTQGQDTDTVMAQGADGQYEPYVVIGEDVLGQRVDRAVGAIGTSSSTNFSIGGFSGRGDAAQGGAGGSGALQQIVARSFVTDCVIGKVIKPKAEPIVFVTQPLPIVENPRQ